MPTQSHPFIAFTDGTTTITCANGVGGLTNYPLVRDSWSPTIPVRNHATLTGEGSYEDVVETIELNIRGSTAAEAYANLDTLNRLLDQAEIWDQEEAVGLNPVRFQYAPQGSTIASTSTPLEAIVLGRAEGDKTSGVQLPVTLNRAGTTYEISGVKVRFRRRQFRIAADTATSAAAQNGNILTATFATSHATPSPVAVALSGFTPSSTPLIDNATLLLITTPGPSSPGSNNRIALVEAETMVPASGFSVVNDALRLARSNGVLRYTPSSTAKTSSAVAVVSGFEPTVRRVAVFAVVRNNSSAVSYRISATVASAYLAVETPEQIIDGSSTNPRPIWIGNVSHPTGKIQSVLLNFTATATGSSIDVDYVVLLAIDDSSSYDIALDAVVLPTAAGNYYLAVDPRRTTAAEPLVAMADTTTVPPNGTANIAAISYRGDTLIEMSGSQIQALWMAPNVTNWRTPTTSATIVQNTLTATRYRTYLTPQ